jgi:hypothetical protein
MHGDRSLNVPGRVTRQCRGSIAAGSGLKRSTIPNLKRDASRVQASVGKEKSRTDPIGVFPRIGPLVANFVEASNRFSRVRPGRLVTAPMTRLPRVWGL